MPTEDGARRNGEVLFAESFAWIAAPHWRPRAGQSLPLSAQGETCSIRAAAVRALDSAGIAWTKVFIGKGAAVVGAAASAEIGQPGGNYWSAGGNPQQVQ